MQSEYQFNINNTPEIDNIANTDDNTDTDTNTNTNINNILIDPNYPDLYKYLTLCAIEQRGIHTLGDIDKNARIGSIEDINFICQYIELALKTINNIDDNEKNFLNDFNSNINNNLMVHLTRDCQIIETGNHYISLTFRSKKNNYVNNIKFKTRFEQKFGLPPIRNNKISISYSIDGIIYENNENNEQNSHHSYIIDIDGHSYYSRKFISNRHFHIQDNLITQLSCKYMLPINHILQPKLNPDACIIC